MAWSHFTNDWWKNIQPRPTIVEMVTKELEKLGIDAIIQYKDHKWKMIFLNEEDKNLYKLIGKRRSDHRIKMVVKRK